MGGYYDYKDDKYHGSSRGKRCNKRSSCIWLCSGIGLVVFLCLYLQLFDSPHYKSLKASIIHLRGGGGGDQTKGGLWPIEHNQFVRVYNGDFVLVEEHEVEAIVASETEEEGERGGNPVMIKKDCQPFYLTGWNAWDISRAARIFPRNHKTVDNLTGKKALAYQFEQAASMGLNVVRAWAHTVDPMYKVMKSPGKYDEAGLRAIDFMLQQAREKGVRVILSLVDNWKYYGGVDEMVDFSKSAPERTSERPRDVNGDFSQLSLNETEKEYEVRRHALFFTDEGSKDIYKNHVKTLLTRRNYYSGVTYKDDPTIFAWNLINEPRCESWVVEDCETSLQNWIQEMAKYVKELDPNHLLTVGSEGFFARKYNGSEIDTDLSADDLNPASWAAFTGQDFVKNHMIDEIDFATVHLWPDNWNQTSQEFQTKWIESHVEAASTILEKPIIVQEFGKKKDAGAKHFEERDRVYQRVEDLVESSVQKRGELKGSLFWNWEIDLLVGAEEDPYTLEIQDSTFGLIKTHAHAMHNTSKSQVYSCDDFNASPLY